MTLSTDPGDTSIVMPRSTSMDPNDLRKSFTRIIGRSPSTTDSPTPSGIQCARSVGLAFTIDDNLTLFSKVYVAYICVNDDKSADAAQFPRMIDRSKGIETNPMANAEGHPKNHRAKPMCRRFSKLFVWCFVEACVSQNTSFCRAGCTLDRRP